MFKNDKETIPINAKEFDWVIEAIIICIIITFENTIREIYFVKFLNESRKLTRDFSDNVIDL